MYISSRCTSFFYNRFLSQPTNVFEQVRHPPPPRETVLALKALIGRPRSERPQPRSRPSRGPAPGPAHPRPAPRRPGFVLASSALCDDATTLTPEDGGGGGRGRGPERVSTAAKTPKSPPPPRGEAARPRATAQRAGGPDELRPGPPPGAPGLSLPRLEPSARARCAGAYGAGEQARRWLLGSPVSETRVALKHAAALGSLSLGPRGPGGRGQLPRLLCSQPASVTVN